MKNNAINPKSILSKSFFKKHPEEFYNFYRKSFCFPNAEPNIAHIFLAKLEECGKLKAVITQNTDGLHTKAGSKNVFEIHGSVLRNHCIKCKKQFDFNYVYSSEGIPKCDKCGGIVRPDITLYNEMLNLPLLWSAERAANKADLLIVAGTSLSVYPAANIVQYFKGDKIVLINKDKPDDKSLAKMSKKKDFLFVQDKIGNVFSQITVLKNVN